MIIKNGNVVLKNSVEKKDILIKDGKIEKIADDIKANGEKVIDASGLHIFPGLIDMHVHLRDPGYEYKEDIESGAKAAQIAIEEAKMIGMCEPLIKKYDLQITLE